jgi:hypothetical protein
MMESGFTGGAYAMASRVPVRRREYVATTTSSLGFKVPSRVLDARAESTTDCPDPQFCKKPVGASTMTLAIVLGVW